jgi:hypothetical protein
MPRISTDPLRARSAQQEAAAKQAAAQARLASHGRHDGLCLRTYADRHLDQAGNPPTAAQSPAHCHCVCPACWDKPTSTCVCSWCSCRQETDRAVATAAHRTATATTTRARQAPQVGFLPPR